MSRYRRVYRGPGFVIGFMGWRNYRLKPILYISVRVMTIYQRGCRL